METSTRRLHPLLTAAAVSVTVFSAVGVAAITGVIPHSKGQTTEETPVAAVEAPAAKPEPAQAPQSAPVPAPKPVKKHVVRHTPPAPAPVPAPTVAANDTPAAPVAPAPVQKPGSYGVVESVKQIELKGDAKGIGAKVFEADKLLVKCPSKYQGAEVKTYT